MSWRAPHLAQFGRFYDALSGEFLPPSDPESRVHTLARLMTATFDKGEITDAHTNEEHRTYKPSWAPISAVVRVCHDDDIRSLIISTDSSGLYVEHTHTGKGERGIQIVSSLHEDMPVIDIPVLGSDYPGVQERVRVVAQDFFNQFSTE